MIESIEQGRKEDGSRSIADKIKSRLHDLDKTVETNYGRWAWELLQNAKDSISDNLDSRVSIQIELFSGSVIFRHNGSYFKELDIRGLINQISSKEVEEGVQTRNTGRFGTGFLTTHLLSRKVEISGIVKTTDEEFHSFNFLLDREGKTTAILAPKVEASWKGFQESTKQINSAYDKNAFNTSFRYLLGTEEQQGIATKGIVEFSKLIPFVLAFIPKIKAVEIIDNLVNTSLKFNNTQEVIDDVITRIEKNENGHISDILIAQLKNDKVSIATEVKKTDTGYSIKSMKDVPKLFCDFPLIGTENFHFPVIVNSFYFSPQTERDGIWLKGMDEEVVDNQQLLENSIQLFKDLINKIAEKNYVDFYNIVTTRIPTTDERYLDKNWYIANIQEPLREFLKQAKIVETSHGSATIGDVYFPDKNLNKEAREIIWQFSSDLKEHKLPIKEHIQKWADVIWSDCSTVDINDLVTDLKGKENIFTLIETLDLDESEMFEWLKECLVFIQENNALNYPTYEIIPNQEGVFKTSKELFLDEIDDDQLKRISKLAGFSYYEKLVHQGLFLEEHPQKKNIENIATKITSLINDENESEDRSLAITMLIEWFGDNEAKGKEYFTSLYSKKEKLLVDTIKDKESLFLILNSEIDIAEIADLVSQVRNNPHQIRESINRAKELDDLLREYGASNVAELKELIISRCENTPTVNNTPQVPIEKVEITQEVLSSLGVTTPQELEEVLKNKSISEQFIHTSIPTTEMFQYAQEKIERAKNNIIDYLREHKDYDCCDLEELAPTVLGGIKKKGLDLLIVVRPSDNKQVIIYYDSEKDSLDYENAELWVEDGKTIPNHLTLGKILKNTGITRIPV